MEDIKKPYVVLCLEYKAQQDLGCSHILFSPSLYFTNKENEWL